MRLLLVLVALLLSQLTWAQGPPITADKPIMLGGKTWMFKTLTELRETEGGTFLNTPIVGHYVINYNMLVGIHIPYVRYDFDEPFHSHHDHQDFDRGQTLGDIQLMGKYQFYRWDRTGKTFRVVSKTVQTLPTGERLHLDGMSGGHYQGYYGIVAGYETIKHGISSELGFTHVPENSDDNELHYKLGFGLPLLKPVYPVNQLNLYFEYHTVWYLNQEALQLRYAQGIQYAIKRATFDLAVELPLHQDDTLRLQDQRKWSLFLGTRYIF